MNKAERDSATPVTEEVYGLTLSQHAEVGRSTRTDRRLQALDMAMRHHNCSTAGCNTVVNTALVFLAFLSGATSEPLPCDDGPPP